MHLGFVDREDGTRALKILDFGLAQSVRGPLDRRIRGVPDLVVEILSAGSKPLDLITKRDDYDAFGVGEYWVVDPDPLTPAPGAARPAGPFSRPRSRPTPSSALPSPGSG